MKAIRGAITLFFLASAVAHGAEWQWSLADGKSRAFLWVPADCQEVRAVVLANHNMIEQGILEHLTFRETLGRLGFAEIWVVPGMDIKFDFHQGAGERFQDLVDRLGEKSGYTELAAAPVVTLGHSANASWGWNFAAWQPKRTLAVLSVKGDAPQTDLTGYGKPKVPWGERMIDGIPGLMVMGEYEWWEDRLTPALRFRREHPQVPLGILGDAAHGHFDCSDTLVAYLAKFIEKAAQARLPEKAGGPLRAVDPEDGWLQDRWRRDEAPAAPAASYAQYRGPRDEAFWCFDKEMAQLTEAHYAAARGKKPQLLSVTDGKMPQTAGNGEPVTPSFVPGEDGVSFQLKATFLDKVPDNSKAPGWTQLPTGSMLGQAGQDEEIVLKRIVGPLFQKGPRTFAYQPGRAEYVADRRVFDMWVSAAHPGNAQYKGAVQQAIIRAIPAADGTPQEITFPHPGALGSENSSVQLGAFSSSGLPVSYFVLDGPAEIEGDMLRIRPLPPRARHPMQVTIVVWQFGRSHEPRFQPAPWVERTIQVSPLSAAP
jgi:hypothetical protein